MGRQPPILPFTLGQAVAENDLIFLDGQKFLSHLEEAGTQTFDSLKKLSGHLLLSDAISNRAAHLVDPYICYIMEVFKVGLWGIRDSLEDVE